ncbi:outer membrane lipoprotein carrier protein LolA [Mucilaginibacter sp. AW1-3]
MRKIIFIFFVLILGFTAKAQTGGYTTVTDLANFKQQFIAIATKTETIKSDFVQEKNLSMLSEKITSKGKFWFKKNSMLRMEFNKPFEYLMILNNDKMYVKDGGKESKVSVKSNKIFQQIDRIIVDCVQGAVFNNPDFIARAYENKGNYKVELTPVSKTLKEFFKNIDVVVDKKNYEVTTIEMNENSGDSTVLHFINKELNTVIPDALFAIR